MRPSSGPSPGVSTIAKLVTGSLYLPRVLAVAGKREPGRSARLLRTALVLERVDAADAELAARVEQFRDRLGRERLDRADAVGEPEDLGRVLEHVELLEGVEQVRAERHRAVVLHHDGV